MKKFIIIILCCLPVMIQAQTFQGGVMFGLAASQVDGDSYAGYNKAGLMGGVFVKTSFINKFSGQLELKYISKGAGAKNKAATSNYYKMRLQYIELPVLVRYEPVEKLNAEAGLAIGYLFKGEVDTDGNGYYLINPPLNDVDLSLVIGANYELLANFDFNVRFQYSIRPIRTFAEGLPTYQTGGLFNNNLIFAFYYQIGR